MQAPDIPSAAAAIDVFLKALGIDPKGDPELDRTGERVARAFADELLVGYRVAPEAVLAEACIAQAEGPKGLISLQGIAITTVCPHHLMPASGHVHLAYLPGAKVAGFGALVHAVRALAQRLMLQEVLAERVVDMLMQSLGARGAGVILQLAPQCITAREDGCQAVRAQSSAFRGVLASDTPERREFLLAASAWRP